MGYNGWGGMQRVLAAAGASLGGSVSRCLIRLTDPAKHWKLDANELSAIATSQLLDHLPDFRECTVDITAVRPPALVRESKCRRAGASG